MASNTGNTVPLHLTTGDTETRYEGHLSTELGAITYKVAGIGVQSSRIRGARRGSLNKNMIR